jgi:hypothetical protein
VVQRVLLRPLRRPSAVSSTSWVCRCWRWLSIGVMVTLHSREPGEVVSVSTRVASSAWQALGPMREHRGSDWVVWTASPRVGLYCTRLEGRADVSAVDHVIEGYEAACQSSPRLDVLHDWSGLKGYAPGARSRFQTWSMERLESVRSVHVLHASAIVAMGVTVVNVLLQGNPRLTGTLHAHWDRARFDLIVEAVARAAP